MKHQKINVLLLTTGFFLLAAVILFYNPLAVSAEEGGGITVYPSKDNISVAPGKGIKKSLLIVNSSTNTVNLKVSVSDFKMTDVSGKVEFYTNDGPYPATKWLVPQYEVITIPPLSSKNMEYIVGAEATMPGQGYAGAIAFQLYDTKTKKTIGDSFGTLVRLNVLGQGITTGGSIKSWTTPAVQFKDPVDFGFVVKNASNSNLSLAGDIVITNLFGKEVKRFKTGSMDIFPKTTRNFAFQWSDGGLFGVYLASINLVDAMRKDNIVTSWKPLLFLPWLTSLLVFIGLCAAIILLVFLHRKYVNKTSLEALAGNVAPQKWKGYIGNILSLAALVKKWLWGRWSKVRNLRPRS